MQAWIHQLGILWYSSDLGLFCEVETHVRLIKSPGKCEHEDRFGVAHKVELLTEIVD